MPNKMLHLKSQRGSGFFMDNLAQSRLEVTNRCFADNRNVPFYLEEKMPYKDLNIQREYQKEYQKEWYKKNGKEYGKKRRENNKEKIRIHQKEWRHKTGRSKKYRGEYLSGISNTKEHRQKYYEENKNKLKIYHKKYNKLWKQTAKGRISQKKHNLIHRTKVKDLSIKIIQLIYEDNIKRYGTLTCYLCLQPIEFKKDHLEHKIPLSRGGTNEYNNLAISCQRCNCKKHAKTETEYREEILRICKQKPY